MNILKFDKALMKYVLFLIGLVLPCSAFAKLMDVAYFELDNGLEVAVIENHKAPVTLQMLHYKTGSINDPVGKGGIAHLLEHMMFRGTRRVPDQMFNHWTDVNGAENNAYTTYDETAYYEFSDVSKLELMMALEADRMQNLDISEEAFLKERDVVLQERYQRFETNPTSLFSEMMTKMLWQNYPLSNPVSGSVDEIKNLSMDDARQFYRLWYRPDNALLILAGDISVDEARSLTEKYYGSIRAGKETLPELSVPNLKAMKTMVKMQLKNVERPRFMSYLYMKPENFSKKEIVALDILAEYLTGDDTAYLSEQLVYQKQLLLGVDSGVSYDDKFGGFMVFYATPQDDRKTAEEIKEILFSSLQKGIHDLKEEDVEKIKNQVLSGVIYLQENPETSARFVGEMLLSGYEPDEIMRYDELVRSIHLEDIKRAWEKVSQTEVWIDGYLSGVKEQ